MILLNISSQEFKNQKSFSYQQNKGFCKTVRCLYSRSDSLRGLRWPTYAAKNLDSLEWHRGQLYLKDNDAP